MMTVLRRFTLLLVVTLMVGCKTTTLPAMGPDTRDNGTNLNVRKPIPVIAQEGAGTFAPQLVVTSDEQINAAIQAAWPTVESMLSLHRCIRSGGLNRLNHLAVPGEDMSKNGSIFNAPNSDVHLRNHDFKKCLTVRQADNWEMPALNTLYFRGVFYADDSGETVNMGYTLRKMDNGSWLLYRIRGRVR